jgi:hypothetical protein
MTLYHHTDSAHLPWILYDRALKPGLNRIGTFPEDFLWATANPMGDPTATSILGPTVREGYRSGKLAAVRFALDDADFTPWTKMKERWSTRHIALLENCASASDIARWHCRAASLPVERWTAVEFRTWTNSRWRPASTTVIKFEEGLGVQLDNAMFVSQQRLGPGATSYATAKLAVETL